MANRSQTLCVMGANIPEGDDKKLLVRIKYLLYPICGRRQEPIRYFGLRLETTFDLLAAEFLFKEKKDGEPIRIISVIQSKEWIDSLDETTKTKVEEFLKNSDKVVVSSQLTPKQTVEEVLLNGAGNLLTYCHSYASETADLIKAARTLDMQVYQAGSLDVRYIK